MKPWIWILLTITIIGLLIWFFYPKKKKEDEKPQPNPNPRNLGSLPPTDFPLRNGSLGKEVLYLQAALNLYHKANLTLDGKLGSNTLDFLKKRFGVNEVTIQNYASLVMPYLPDLDRYLIQKGVK